jgi:methionyl-tRNA formyltransferase
MKIFVYPAEDEIGQDLARKVRAMVHQHYDLSDTVEGSDLAVAPCILRRIQASDAEAPRLGTLVFHPSLLPRNRGQNAILSALRSGETFTGVSWFWLEDGWDTGDICEQEMLGIPTASDFAHLYKIIMTPAAVRALERALFAISHGVIRRVPQDPSAASDSAAA